MVAYYLYEKYSTTVKGHTFSKSTDVLRKNIPQSRNSVQCTNSVNDVICYACYPLKIAPT